MQVTLTQPRWFWLSFHAAAAGLVLAIAFARKRRSQGGRKRYDSSEVADALDIAEQKFFGELVLGKRRLFQSVDLDMVGEKEVMSFQSRYVLSVSCRKPI
jgi:hypothetical protein